MNLQPVTLSGNRVVLEPLHDRHARGLLSAAAHDEIWAFLDEPTPNTLEQIRGLIDDAQREQGQGMRLAFAVIDRASDAAVGSTSYIDIRPKDRGLEIGWTWTTPSVWRTGINAESKYLLLRHAFEEQAAIRVAIKTDLRNIPSQRAIEALGASREGVWRNHRILSTGRYRDTVYYSVIESEWPAVKSRIEARLSTYGRDLAVPHGFVATNVPHP
jgi:RimJ/RimL family protein N-acetyltransferase